MADLSAPPAPRGGRGQLMLVTAVGLAAMLILLAVLLNSVIYTENVATRGGQQEHASEAWNYRVDADRGVAGILRRSNRDGDSYAAFRENASRWNELAGRHAARNGVTAHIAVNSTTDGTRIAQDNRSRTLTNAADADRWTLVTAATDLPAWEMTVSRPSLVVPAADTDASDLEAADAFRVEIDGNTDSWRVFVYQDGAQEVLVAVEDSTGTLASPCRAPEAANGTVRIDIVAATVGGTACPALEPITGMAAYDVTFDEGTNAEGTYALVVDEPVTDVQDGDYAAGGASPYAAPYVYDVTIDVTFRTPALRYHADGVPVTQEVR